MPWREVVPVIDAEVQKLCVWPYPGHPKGCPNYGKRIMCPPAAPMLGEDFDLGRPVFAVWNAFDFGAHAERMKAKHPDWSARQCACCLYWQPTARRALRREIAFYICESVPHEFVITMCPEANGVNVTETMRQIGIELQWPPRTVAYQVALGGHQKPPGA